jgi:hypothetical protein
MQTRSWQEVYPDTGNVNLGSKWTCSTLKLESCSAYWLTTRLFTALILLAVREVRNVQPRAFFLMHFLQGNAGILPRLGHDRFLPNPFHFTLTELLTEPYSTQPSYCFMIESSLFFLFPNLYVWEFPTWATIDRCPLLCNGLLISFPW